MTSEPWQINMPKALCKEFNSVYRRWKRTTLPHYLLYQVLGISDEEGRLIDVYQSKGRFLYNYAGRFLEAAAKRCFVERFPTSWFVLDT